MLAAALALLAAPTAAAPPLPATNRTMHFGLARRPRSPGYVVRVLLPARGREVRLPPIAGPDDPRLPLVVIDPGHGGFDAGAQAPHGRSEKAVALALATALRAELLKRARVRVALTRRDDRFLALAERAGMARRLGADLFISLHAAAPAAPAAGARVFTLAAKGAAGDAAEVAARENGADRPGGRVLGGEETGTDLSPASRQRMVERSAVLARLIVREGRKRVPLGVAPRRSGHFAVLRALAVPAVLIEASTSTAGGDAPPASATATAGLAQAIARAIDTYFDRLPPER